MASYAAVIRDAVEVPVELESGRWGQFDVIVGDRTVVSRKGGLIAKLTGRPWPSDEDVVGAIRNALTAPEGS